MKFDREQSESTMARITGPPMPMAMNGRWITRKTLTPKATARNAIKKQMVESTATPALLETKFVSPVQPMYWPRMASAGLAIQVEMKMFQYVMAMTLAKLAPMAMAGCRMRELNTYSPPLRGIEAPRMPQTTGAQRPQVTAEMSVAMSRLPPRKRPTPTCIEYQMA